VQVKAIKRLMSPAVDSKGVVLYAYPYIPGTETQWSGWNYYGKPGGSSLSPPRLANMDLPAQHAGYLADETIRRNIDALTFNFDRDPSTLSRSRRIYDATNFDLRSFKARGGKILMWHGWADGAIMATSSIGYFEGVQASMGGRAKTEDFFRLFLVPGVHHGGGGPGLSAFDSFSALEDWVEKGVAPDKLIAARVNNGEVERTRPIYPYPIVAQYSGNGNPKAAESFVPFDPTTSQNHLSERP
jgi:Tannase and feruloyl esterase